MSRRRARSWNSRVHATTRPSPRRLGFRVALAAGILVLAGGMLLSVERGSRARRLSDQLSALDRQTTEARSRLADAMRRMDSLSSRERIVAAAARLGLHPASDADITFLRADTASVTTRGSEPAARRKIP